MSTLLDAKKKRFIKLKFAVHDTDMTSNILLETKKFPTYSTS